MPTTITTIIYLLLLLLLLFWISLLLPFGEALEHVVRGIGSGVSWIRGLGFGALVKFQFLSEKVGGLTWSSKSPVPILGLY